MNVGPVIESLLRGEDLSSDTAGEVMSAFMDGEASDAEVAGFLVALRSKGATGPELAAFARAMRQRAVTLPHGHANLVDTCGTGGGIPSFNISTAAAIVASAAGATVAKHGNRAMSSKCGSADVLEALGATLTNDSDRLCTLLDEVGLAFFFAPSHHPAMRHVGPVRKQLGIRTVFNQLGPLANPAGAKRQVIGIYDPKMGPAMAEAAAELGGEKVWVVHGEDGLDEVSPCAPTRVWEAGRSFLVPMSEFGMASVDPAALTPGESAGENAEILREAISDPHSLRSMAIRPSAATALYVAGVAASLAEGAKIAMDAISTGAAAAKLEQFVEATRV